VIIAPQETRTQLSALSVQKKDCDRHAIQPILGLLYSERSLQSFQLAGEYPFPFDTVNPQITILVDWTHLPLRLHEQNFRIIEKRQEKLDFVVGPVRLVPESLSDSADEEQQFLSDSFIVPSVSPFIEEKVQIVA
jgi:hypothetical protein